MAPKTKAVSNLARSAAARSGWPVLQGYKVPLYALSNVARSNATRSNYTSGKTFISIGGVPLGEGAVVGGAGVLAKSVTINDSLNDVPTTAQLTFYKYVPVEGSDVVITLGSKNNLHREFGGTILSSSHQYVGDKPVDQNMVYPSQLIDYSWGLTRKKYSGKFQTNSVATIASAIVAAAAPGYGLFVAPDIGAVIIDEMTFTEQTVADALHQLVKRVGGDWFCDYLQGIQLFFTYTADAAPTIINRAHLTMRDLQWSRDLSQVVSRVYCECGGSDALEAVAVGATQIPVGTAAWYEVGGGVVLAGQQRVNYTGVSVGGGGSLVGPGAAPSAAITATVVSGAGVTVGVHDYAVTYVTAQGESIPSPRTTVNVGVIAPPTAAPALDPSKPILAGPGPDPGQHDYAITFVSNSGETTPGPRLTLSSANVTPAPTTGPTPVSVGVAPGPDPGPHDYAVIYQTASGYTTPGPIGGQIVTGVALAAPTYGPSGSASAGAGLTPGSRIYAVTFVNASGGETTPGPPTTLTTPAVPPPSSAPGWQTGVSNQGCLSGAPYPGNNWGWAVTYVVGGGGETTPGPRMLFGDSTSQKNFAYQVSIPIGPAGTVARRLYRTGAYSNQGDCNTAPLGLEKTINDNSTTATLAGVPCTTGGAPVGDAALGVMNLTSIQLGPSGTVARKIYRSVAGGTQLKYVATINDNSYSAYTDTLPDANLGANAPTSNTAGAGPQSVHLTGIPKGTGADASTVLYRLIYRRSAGQGLRYCGALMDNSSTTFDDTILNANLGSAPPATNTAYLQQLPLTLPVGGPFIINRKLYRTKVNTPGSTVYLVGTVDNVQTQYTDTTADSGLGAAAPSVNNAVAAQVNVSAVPLGAAAVTARRIYRTAAGASQLKLLVALADNVTTIYTDVLADAALGVNAPTSDTSLLAQPAGNVLQGATTMPVASVASFLPLGGWVIAASQILRYTSITGNSLTGIPASGPGSIGATLTFNSTIVAAPMLTGVPTSGPGTIRFPIVKGDPVDVFVQEDDLNAQAAIRLQLPGSDGIIEDEIQDRRLSATEGRARARARLNMLASLDSQGKVGIVSVTYTCRDINTRAGQNVDINIGPPINLLGTFLIQRVTVSKFYVPHLPPTYTVEASSVRFSYEEFLRFIRDAGE